MSGNNTSRPLRRGRNFFLDEDEIVQETKRLDQQYEAEMALERQRIDEELAAVRRKRSLEETVQRGFNWLTGFEDKSPPTETNDLESVMIETYFVKDLFDDVAAMTSELSQSFKTEIKQLEAKDQVILSEFIDTGEHTSFLEYINDDQELVTLFRKLPTAVKIANLLDARLRKLGRERKLQNYDKINSNKNMEIVTNKEVLSVYINRFDYQTKKKLLDYKGLFVDFYDLISTQEKDKIKQFQENSVYDPGFKFDSIWINNYARFKAQRKIIVYDCEFTYPIQWLQEKDYENVAIQSRRLTKFGVNQNYHLKPDECHINDIRHEIFHRRSRKMNNSVTIIHDILNFFRYSEYITYKF